MAGKRLKRGEHGDRGDGACQVCFEEVPCAFMRGEKAKWDRSGIGEWAAEEQRRQREERELARDAQQNRINAFFAEHGIDVKAYGSYTTSVTLAYVDMLKIIDIVERVQ